MKRDVPQLGLMIVAHLLRALAFLVTQVFAIGLFVRSPCDPILDFYCGFVKSHIAPISLLQRRHPTSSARYAARLFS
jgi:hypothetical protein